jgi:hypothetical protein
MTTTKRRRLSFAALEDLIEELDGVRSILPSRYLVYGDDDDEGAYVEEGKIESADVEVAISSVISTMTDKCRLRNEPETLSELIEKLFSPDDELVNLAINLEDAINGYFGEIFGEDLDLADDYLADIISALKERRDKWKTRVDSQIKLKPE